MRDEYSHGREESPVNYLAMFYWVPGLALAPSPVESFHKTVEPELRKLLNGWDLEKLPPGRSLSPKIYYKRMFEAPPRTWSEYSLKPVPMTSVLTVLGSITVEFDHRICGADCKRTKRF